MAFQQPQQRPQTQRPSSPVNQGNALQAAQQPSPGRRRTIEESQEWILFSPANNGDLLSTTSQTPRTATHLSDVGSLETHVRSQPFASSEDAGDASNALGTDIDDDVSLDSLDDGLHAFHHPFSTSSNHLDMSGGTVLPTHDGLGTFPSSAGLQEQLWQFERYNPHRRRSHVRRKSSIQRRIDELEEEHELHPEGERTARIEKWRLEQSRAVLEEIERETKRRQRRMSRASGVSATTDDDDSQAPLEAIAEQRSDTPVQEEQPAAVETVGPEQEPAQESFWQRITKRVIQDLIGLDDTTLSVIFGEQLVEDPSPTPTQPSPIAQQAAQESRATLQNQTPTWEVKLLDRIARELGVLVHQLSEHERGAFSTYMRAIGEEPGYAGMPAPRTDAEAATRPSRQRKRRLSNLEHPAAPSSESQFFKPTIPQNLTLPLEAPDSSLWGIDEEPSKPTAADEAATRQQQQEQQCWEQDIDVRMIFSYLRRRFSSTPTPPAPTPTTTGPLPASWATASNAHPLGTSQDSIRRAELIKRQHPLVSRAAERAAAAAQTRRRDSILKRHHVQTITQRRAAGSSSCASQSTNKRSRHSKSASLVSSRNYWDLGGSFGSVSVSEGAGGALGVWGEV
ncbi:hypothetical protein K431DRAFT_319797 [Polychaeton citri CBS 116435]|uniref:Uncharacterized protein n=1 Tax=Polychaeton citri CBS 116435 TaxID=1314669 RepID=A0A9P4URB8_9PEZI|nr:hypothetical protein K431DRAFT_319797 [Polychaeton citri CBS 116435]